MKDNLINVSENMNTSHRHTAVKAARPRVGVRRKTKALAACTLAKTRRCLR